MGYVMIYKVDAQTCGTVVTKENLRYMENVLKPESRINKSTHASTDVIIPIKFHTIMNSSGDGGLTSAQVSSIISRLNSLYSNSNITFEHQDEPNVIVDDANYRLNRSNEGAVASANDIAGIINIYFSGSLLSETTSLCGYTRFPPSSDRIFTTYSCTLNGTTLEHELGHYFTLFHTHGKTNTGTTDELIDGSNCTTAGDNVCDTPADPNLTGMVEERDCSYTGSARDANGQAYEPDPRNIMAYSLNPCRDLFTRGQFSRIRDGFENGRFYLRFLTESFTTKFTADDPSTCIGSKVSFDGDAFGAISYEWSFEGGTPPSSTSEDPVITYNNAGIFGVTLTAINSLEETSTLSRSTFVSITDPLSNTLTGTYSTTVQDGVPPDFSVENKDEAITFAFRGDVDSNEDSESGVLWIDNFNYNTELNRNLDQLVLRNYNTDGIRKFIISFDYAYTHRPIDFENDIPAVCDSLEVILASQCGSTEVKIWRDGGESLATANPILSEFIPASTEDWESKTIVYDVPEELDFARIAFRNISKNGNNTFIDNIRIEPDFTVEKPIDFRLSKVENKIATIRWFDGSINETAYVLERSVSGSEFEVYKELDPNVIFYRDTLTEGESYKYRLYADGVNGNRSDYSEVIEILPNQVLSVDESYIFYIYPNPVSDNLVIKGNGENVSYYVSDLAGKVLLNGNLTKMVNYVDFSGFENGIYLFYFNGGKEVRRIIKQ